MSEKGTKPHKHRVALYEPRESGLSATAWSYIRPKSREVFVQVRHYDGHFVTCRVLVPR